LEAAMKITQNGKMTYLLIILWNCDELLNSYTKKCFQNKRSNENGEESDSVVVLTYLCSDTLLSPRERLFFVNMRRFKNVLPMIFQVLNNFYEEEPN